MEDLINSKAKEFFGLDYVYPYQRLVISNTLKAGGFYSWDEKSEAIPRQIVLLPTGAGKSLCFMLPGILMDGVTLIVFPLLSLMADQERRIIEAGSKALILKGGITPPKKIDGETKFILTNPETLRTKKVLEFLLEVDVKHVVIDETHTVSQWGETFRPSYLEVGGHINTIGVKLVTAYTATASDYIIQSVIKNIFLDESVNIVRGNPDRTNIHYSVIPSICKDETLIDIVKNIETPAIIFHSSRVSAEVTNSFLVNRLNRGDIVYYHAGLTKEQKASIEKWFFSSDKGILNSTCAYGMGVDKQNIRTVIHMDTPTSIESYLQESGRGGRDRNPAKALLLTSKEMKNDPIFSSLSDNHQCRRDIYLNLLGATIDYCTGCDVCDGSVITEELGKIQILKFYEKNRAIFNLEESSRILKGFYTFSAIQNQYHNTHGFGILHSWDLDSIKLAINTLIENKELILIKNIFYRNKIKLIRKERKFKV